MQQLHYKILGFIALGLGTLGAFLPLLPTTVFVLIAAWCFAKSSPKWHQRLLNNPTFGPMIKHWETDRCIPPKARLAAVLSMGIAGTVSFVLLDSWLWRGLLILLLALGFYSIFFAHRWTLNQHKHRCPQAISHKTKNTQSSKHHDS